MSAKFGILTKSRKSQKFFFIKSNIQRFSFLFVYYISQNIWLRQRINEKINKGKLFAILQFACKMLQNLSSKMLKRCPLQYSVVLKSRISRHLKYMANSPQSAVSECSYLLQHLITKKLKSPDSDDSDDTCRSTTKRIFSSFRPV